MISTTVKLKTSISGLVPTNYCGTTNNVSKELLAKCSSIKIKVALSVSKTKAVCIMQCDISL